MQGQSEALAIGALAQQAASDPENVSGDAAGLGNPGPSRTPGLPAHSPGVGHNNAGRDSSAAERDDALPLQQGKHPKGPPGSLHAHGGAGAALHQGQGQATPAAKTSWFPAPGVGDMNMQAASAAALAAAAWAAAAARAAAATHQAQAATAARQHAQAAAGFNGYQGGRAMHIEQGNGNWGAAGDRGPAPAAPQGPQLPAGGGGDSHGRHRAGTPSEERMPEADGQPSSSGDSVGRQQQTQPRSNSTGRTSRDGRGIGGDIHKST